MTQAGLFEFYNGEMTRHWNDENSPIYYHYNIPKPDKNYEVVSSVLFDKDGNLWVANTGSTKSTLLKLTADNTWAIPGNAISAENSDYLKFMGFDNKGSLWIHNNAYGAAAAYRYKTICADGSKCDAENPSRSSLAAAVRPHRNVVPRRNGSRAAHGECAVAVFSAAC